jgi:shikimate kinase
MRIVLLGYMASGKSTVGKLLAGRLSVDFIDMDEWLEKETGKTVAEIFQTEGESTFREKEKQMLDKLLKKKDAVIAAGGGTPCFFDNMERISANAVSVYLKAEAGELSLRLSDPSIRSKRPLLKNAGKDLHDFINKSLQEREPYYMKANLVIKTKGKGADKIADEIIFNLGNAGALGLGGLD